MSTDKLTWYVARSGGIVAWVLLALGLILGLLLSSRVLSRRRASPAWILSVHRFLGGLSVIFTAVHVAAIMLDDFVDFGFVEVLVPWASNWKPTAVAWGVIAMYLMVAIELTSFAMKQLPRRVWRAVHWSSGPLFLLATIHGYQAGTDAGRAFIIAIVISMLVLTALTVVRIMLARARVDPAEIRAMAATAERRRQVWLDPPRAEPPETVAPAPAVAAFGAPSDELGEQVRPGATPAPDHRPVGTPAETRIDDAPPPQATTLDALLADPLAATPAPSAEPPIPERRARPEPVAEAAPAVARGPEPVAEAAPAPDRPEPPATPFFDQDAELGAAPRPAWDPPAPGDAADPAAGARGPVAGVPKRSVTEPGDLEPSGRR